MAYTFVLKTMTTRYPDYPRDEDGEIPEPLCYDLLRIRPEIGYAYIWDMNGVCITLSCVTNREDDEPLDIELEQWQSIYEFKPLDENHDPKWDSAEEQQKFDDEGANLARRVFEFFAKTKTIIYYPTRGGEQRIDAEGRESIRM